MANQRPYYFTAFEVLYSGHSASIETTMGFAVSKYPAFTPWRYICTIEGGLLFVAHFHFLVIDISPIFSMLRASIPITPSEAKLTNRHQ